METNARPCVFVGSSTEGLQCAQAIQQNLDHEVECVLWSQGVFGLSEGTLASLVNFVPKIDFAVLVLTPDDLVESRGEQNQVPRDNVLLEAGIFIGSIGVDRTFLVVDRSAKIKLPTDLAGITTADYAPPGHGNWQSALGSASSSIGNAVRTLGLRERSRRISLQASFHGGVDGAGVTMRVTNETGTELLPYDLVLSSPRGTFRFFDGSATGKLYDGQFRDHRWTHIALSKRLAESADGIQPDLSRVPHINSAELLEREMLDGDPNDAVFRIQVQNSERVLFESRSIGIALMRYGQQELVGDAERIGGSAFHLLTRACWNPHASIEDLEADCP